MFILCNRSNRVETPEWSKNKKNGDSGAKFSKWCFVAYLNKSQNIDYFNTAYR